MNLATSPESRWDPGLMRKQKLRDQSEDIRYDGLELLIPPPTCESRWTCPSGSPLQLPLKSPGSIWKIWWFESHPSRFCL